MRDGSTRPTGETQRLRTHAPRHAPLLPTVAVAALALALQATVPSEARAQGPTVVDPGLAVRTVVSGLVQPTTMAFLGHDDFLVLEKASGRVQRIQGGVVTATVLDLPVNSNSERGLLGIALHPKFRRHPWVYLYWTESSTGADSTLSAEVGNPGSPYPPGTPRPFGNRVDRFRWNGQTLTYDMNLVRLRAFQQDATNPDPGGDPLGRLRGNHNGGVIAFERDRGDGHHDHHDGDHDGHRDDDARDEGRGDEREHDGDRDHRDGRGRDDDRDKARLFIFIGDNGRRGHTQNLAGGPSAPPADRPDDQFGGPEPDDAHLTGVILRLNDDGTTPARQPVLRGRRGDGRRGRRQHPEDLRLRRPQQLRHGVRPAVRQPVEPGERRRRVRRAQPHRAGHERRLDPDHGAAVARRRVQGDRDDLRQPEPATCSRSAGRPTNIADTPEEALSRLFMLPGAALQRPGVQLEVRGRAGRASASSTAGRSGRSTRATCSWAPRARP